MAGFTASVGQYGKEFSSCRGMNHSDQAVIGYCDGCGSRVAKIEGKGWIVEAHTAYSSAGYSRETYYCFQRHTCSPEAVAAKAAEDTAKIMSGEIVKGAAVEVFKGRKVPVGTIGKVIWQGEDNWGKARIGIKTEAGETHFLAEDNCRVFWGSAEVAKGLVSV